MLKGFLASLVVAEALLDFACAELLAETEGDVGEVGEAGGVVTCDVDIGAARLEPGTGPMLAKTVRVPSGAYFRMSPIPFPEA